MEGEHMHRIVPPRGKIEWNLNTIVQLVGLLIIAGGGVTAWNRTNNRIDTLEAWRIEHEADVKGIIADAAAARAGLTARADQADSGIRDVGMQVDRLNYRVGSLEAKGAQIDGALAELQRTISEQSGDLKVIREILQRLDKAQKGADR